ncbi:hypothetical protein Q9S36_44390 [Microbacterium sp. ARD31]|uniref:hypothetical protein n=1 Tax=Microbacterium sp. ARD31 TaxID=2962576 RepID=UPI002881615A|nr:hypothetical protein [Microbacterium sp. ARD31]MDT0187247.1 hypothetical protein [Microbacterium sp. ARD31]
MSLQAVRKRVTAATVVAVAAALLSPTQGGAATPAGGARNTLEVSGTVLVTAGEGEDDRYSLLLPSGRTVELADGFTAEPLSAFAGTLAVPGVGTGARLTGSMRASTLRRAATSGTPMEVVDARTSEPAPSPGPTNHTTYVAKVTNFGPIALTDAQIIATVDASQAYWVRESGGQIPSWTRVSGVVPVASTAGSAAGGCGLGNGGADFGAITQAVGSAAFPGVDFSGASSNHLVVVVPNGCGGTTSGRGRIGTSFGNGGAVIIDARPQPQPTLDHEFGHNVGLQHANNRSAEYGDVYEVMGAGPDQYRSPVLGTVYRWEQGIVAAGETVDGSGGGSWSLAPRAAASGLRSVVFIDPDNGRRHFVDYRTGTGNDAGTCYVSGSCNYTSGSYGQDYLAGLTVERENETSGAFLQPVPGNDGVLTGGEAWTSGSGRLRVVGNGSSVTITRGAAIGTVSGGTAGMTAPTALRDVTATASGFTPAPGGYRYQWLINGQPVPGAEDPTFQPTPAMAGGALSVTVTAYAPGYDPVSRTSAPQTVAPAAWYANGTRRYPEITGSTRVGGVLTAQGLDWVDYYGQKPGGYAPVYRWTRNGDVIKGVTGSTYRLTRKDKGKKIQVSEFPRAFGFASTTYARSEATRRIRIGKLVTTRPTIGGKAKVGKRVKARVKGWTKGTKLSYRWFAGKKAIRGGTGKKLRITRSLRGKKLVVKVTGKKKGFRSATVKSRPKKVK